MVTLKIGNSECEIKGLTGDQTKEVRELMCFIEDTHTARFTGLGRPVKKYLMDKRGRFPTGLLYILRSWQKLNKIVFHVDDTRTVPHGQDGLFNLKLEFEPYIEQREAAWALKAKKRGIISAPTGCGKSLIATMIINELQVPTLVVVPSLELRSQLITAFASAFGANKVGRLKDKRAIAVENVDSISTDKQITGYDCVIIDEFHHSGAKTYRKLNQKAFGNIYYRCGLTATPFRSKDNEKILLESVLSETIYQISYTTAVEKGYIVPMEAFFYRLPKRKTNYKTWQEAYSNLVVNNHARNELIAHFLKAMKEADLSTLCLVKEIKHGENIQAITPVFFANGENEDTNELISYFNYKKLCVLIGTTGVLGEGVDTKPCEYVFIAGLGKSKNAFMQQCGRAFRRYPGKESCKIILICDHSNKWTLAHFKEQVKYLAEEYGVVPTELEIPEFIKNK